MGDSEDTVYKQCSIGVQANDTRKEDDEIFGFYDDVLDTTAIDPVLTRKMTLVNAAIDRIGMTSFQWKLFFLNGFGYAVDSVGFLEL